jgi:hypothetical protein
MPYAPLRSAVWKVKTVIRRALGTVSPALDYSRRPW